MRSETVDTYTVDIYMAGDSAHAMQVCREHCMKGLCVTITPTDFIYTGGQESGFCVGLINYPRFPSSPDALWAEAVTLADKLRDRLCQHSYSIVAPDKTMWSSHRE